MAEAEKNQEVIMPDSKIGVVCMEISFLSGEFLLRRSPHEQQRTPGKFYQRSCKLVQNMF
jgi:hypothetical protein